MVSTVVILKGHKFDLWPSYNHVIMCFMIDFELDCLQAVLNWRTNFISVGGRYSQGSCHTNNKGPGCLAFTLNTKRSVRQLGCPHQTSLEI